MRRYRLRSENTCSEQEIVSTLERQVFLPRNRNGCLATQAITEKETAVQEAKDKGKEQVSTSDPRSQLMGRRSALERWVLC